MPLGLRCGRPVGDDETVGQGVTAERVDVSRKPTDGPRRYDSRCASPRSLSLDGGDRLGGRQELDRGPEPRHVRLPWPDRGPRCDSRAYRRAVGLREVRCALPARRTLLLYAQRWPAGPECPLLDGDPRGGAQGPPRSEPALGRRHRRPYGLRGQRRRKPPGLRTLRRRIGLAGVAGPRSGERR